MKKMIIGLILIVLGVTGWVYTKTVEKKMPPEGIPQVVPPNEIPSGTPPEIPSGKKGVSVRGTNWVWQSIQNGNAKIEIKNPSIFILTLDAEGRFTSTTDCNSVSGSYVLEGESLTFKDMASTLMYCEGSQENTYTEALGKVSMYRVEGNTLILSLTNKGEMRFRVK
jgi:heat shock protein HslJ